MHNQQNSILDIPIRLRNWARGSFSFSLRDADTIHTLLACLHQPVHRGKVPTERAGSCPHCTFMMETTGAKC